MHVFVAKFLALLADIPDWSEQAKVTEFKAKANPDLAVSFALMTPQPTTLEEHIRLLTVFEQQQKEQRLQQKNYLKQANSRSHNSLIQPPGLLLHTSPPPLRLWTSAPSGTVS